MKEWSEPEFAARVEAIAAEPEALGRLTELLFEEHPAYDERSAAAVVRMRGWVLLALARVGVTEAALVFVLDELDAGVDPYLVAAAARALRSYPAPDPSLAPFVLRALDHIRYRDEPISFEAYGEYADSCASTSSVRELLDTFSWLGPHAREVLPALESLRNQAGGLSKHLRSALDETIRQISHGSSASPTPAESCCALPGRLSRLLSWGRDLRGCSAPVWAAAFEDQDGSTMSFKEFFCGHPSIVVFFYTRCDNPLKCSLTITKLARVQQLLEARGLADQVRTAAITYDPAFDLSGRIRGYGESRGVRLGPHHRMLRATSGFEALRRHFQLGVNFIESLVNRHKIEVYLLDAQARVAASFQRLHWDEQEVVDYAARILQEEPANPPPRAPTLAPVRSHPPARFQKTSPIAGVLGSLGVAFFPKCPLCWAGYLSWFGIAGLGQAAFSPWLQLALAVAMLLNLGTLWLRGHSTGRMNGFWIAAGGALAIALSKLAPGCGSLALWGVVLTLTGSLWSALGAPMSRPRVESPS